MPDDAKPAIEIDPEKFAALTNLMHTLLCEDACLSVAQMGDVLYYDANRTVCSDSRDAARAILAFLGMRFTGSQPVHQPGGGCRFSEPDGTCDFHDIRHANQAIDQVEAQMRAGKGTLAAPLN